MKFSSHLDLVVTVAVRLVNALTAGEARGRTYSAPAGRQLLSAAVAAIGGEHGEPRITGQEASELQAIAAELRVVFDAVAAGAMDAAAHQINKLLAETGARPWLDRHDAESWHLHFHGGDDTFVNGWAASCATGLAIVLGSDMRGRLGVCGAARCDRVYVDTSRNGTRRFCSTSCQNRVKTAAFRARRGLPGTAAPYEPVGTASAHR